MNQLERNENSSTSGWRLCLLLFLLTWSCHMLSVIMNRDTEVPWHYGHRIVDMSELAKQMQCRECSLQLDLNRTQNESRHGLASVLVIACRCGVLNNVHTSKRTKTDRGAVIYTVNAQFTACLLQCEMGMDKVQRLLAALRIPITPLENTQLGIGDTVNCNIQNIVPSCSVDQHHDTVGQTAYSECETSGLHLTPSVGLETRSKCGDLLHGIALKHQPACQQLSSVKEEILPQSLSDMSAFHSGILTTSGTGGNKSLDSDTDHDINSGQEEDGSKSVGLGGGSHYHHTQPKQRSQRMSSRWKKKRKVGKKYIPESSRYLHPDTSMDENLTDTDAFLDGLVAGVPELSSIEGEQEQDKSEHYLTVHFSHDASTDQDRGATDRDSRSCRKKKQGRKVCDMCGVYLSNRSALSRHRRSKHHTGEPLVCPAPGCDKKFARSELLESHINCIHSSCKPFQCSRCGKQFGSKKYMLDHMARCGRQPYKCHVCDMSFRDRAARRDHVAKYHKGQQFFACHCGKVYGWRTSLLKHQKKCYPSLP